MEAGETTDALIVLPEAFNIAVPYRGEGVRNFDRMILTDLRDLSRRFNATFVAGLAIKDRCGPTPPHSAAYLIESTRSTLICYKVGDDGMAGINYTVRTEQADIENPIEHRGVHVAALICLDANPTARLAPLLLPRLQKIVGDSDVVCVPAHMARDNVANSMVGSDAAIALPWSKKRLVLANSKHNGIASFITDDDGKILEPTVGGAQNKVLMLPFS